jgi:hypothetical protein
LLRSEQESGVREIRTLRSMRQGQETEASDHRASSRPYRDRARTGPERFVL